MREIRKRVPNQNFAGEQNCRKFESLVQVPYEVLKMPMEFRANKAITSEYKAGDRYLKPETPVVYTDMNSLTMTTLQKLQLYDLLEPEKFHDKKIWVKIFMDADSTSMKISQNILNQKAPNAAHKHILQIYSECPDKEFNIGQLMGVFNKGLNEFKYQTHNGQDIRLWYCADTKQIWQLLGMPVSPGTYPCPYCKISYKDMKIPLTRRADGLLKIEECRVAPDNIFPHPIHFHNHRVTVIKFQIENLSGLRPERCYGEHKHLYDMNRRLTGLNRLAQKEFFNVIDEPKLLTALNGDDDSPLIDWIAVPILHLNLRVGEDIYTKGLELVQGMDKILLKAIRSGTASVPPHILPGTDFMKAVEGEATDDDLNCGPHQSSYQKLCSSIGCRPAVYFGGSTLCGNHAFNLVTRYEKMVPFWQELLTSEILSSEGKMRLEEDVKDLLSLMRTYSPLIRKLGGTERLTADAISELDMWIAGFLMKYRKMFSTFPPKLHILEDHIIPQLRIIQHGLGVLSEQGGESSHKLIKDIRQRYAHSNSESEIVLRTVQKATTDAFIRLREV